MEFLLFIYKYLCTAPVPGTRMEENDKNVKYFNINLLANWYANAASLQSQEIFTRNFVPVYIGIVEYLPSISLHQKVLCFCSCGYPTV